MIDWVAEELGASFVALNPLHAIHNRRPFNTSPYLPNCIFYQNFLYLDVEGMEDYQRCRRARALRESPEVAREIEELRATPFVEYERVSALKMRFLKLGVRAVSARVAHRQCRGRARFEAFREREGDLLETFATYCALDEELHRANPDLWVWTDWPAPYQDPCSAETRAFRQKRWRRVMFYQYLQWQIDLQLAGAQQWARDRHLSIGLYHDLALATDRFGSDLWAHRPFYVAGCRVGSPPDDFSPKGQDWAFPPPNSARHREDGYRLFAESIRKNCRHGGALRIDHVMRLFRLFWIPDGVGSDRGRLRARAQRGFRPHPGAGERAQSGGGGGRRPGHGGAVDSRDAGALRHAELPPLLFRKERARRIPRAATSIRAQALVSSTTHDLPTLAGFWVGADIDARRAAGIIDDEVQRAQLEQRRTEKQKMLDVLFQLELVREDLPRSAEAYPELTGELHNAIVGFLAMTPSQLLAINQEDLTKEVHQQNLPGSTWQYPNWGRKMRFTIEQLRGDGDDSRLHHHVPRLDRALRPQEPGPVRLPRYALHGDRHFIAHAQEERAGVLQSPFHVGDSERGGRAIASGFRVDTQGDGHLVLRAVQGENAVQLHLRVARGLHFALHAVRPEDDVGVARSFQNAVMHAAVAVRVSARAAGRIYDEFARHLAAGRVEGKVAALQFECSVDGVHGGAQRVGHLGLSRLEVEFEWLRP